MHADVFVGCALGQRSQDYNLGEKETLPKALIDSIAAFIYKVARSAQPIVESLCIMIHNFCLVPDMYALPPRLVVI